MVTLPDVPVLLSADVAVNVLGLAHAIRHRGKPVDTHTRRPVAPRFMTANLIMERSQCFPLDRQDDWPCFGDYSPLQ